MMIDLMAVSKDSGKLRIGVLIESLSTRYCISTTLRKPLLFGKMLVFGLKPRL